MAKEFIDDDLLKTDDSGEDWDEQDSDGMARVARHREELTDQVAGATDEIERLRMRQMELEKAKKSLEELTQRHEEYDQGKKEMIDKLTRGLTMVEKEEVQATRMVELLSETRSRFKELLNDLSDIDETKWSENNFKTELSRALVKVDIARADYKKALARIDVVSWYKSGGGDKQSDMFREMTRDVSDTKSFGYWLKVGLAASLPLIIVIILAVITLWIIAHSSY